MVDDFFTHVEEYYQIFTALSVNEIKSRDFKLKCFNFAFIERKIDDFGDRLRIHISPLSFFNSFFRFLFHHRRRRSKSLISESFYVLNMHMP